MSSIRRSLHVEAPPKTVWALLAKYEDASWHPLVTDVEILSEGPTDVGSVRACRFQGGLASKERIVELRENETFTIDLYDIEGPIARARSRWTLRPESKGTRVDVHIDYEPTPGAPAADVEAALTEHLRIATDGIAATAAARAGRSPAVRA